ncbi:hypothetical protein GRZ55_03145 [Chelativorans sp. ZYF759]|uniref:hypothetical protein n=1 Tax=Chelativorans sp. ZYF759 TaxID=2692213 RepID=UPI00145F37AA|nr:hypothetical protein [Chelativorans sp. ZYF759]NMG38236.1 hypothetical protein [Chelativorans sp. ZYF759]
MTEQTIVRRRLVVFLPGFEAMPSVAHAKRFRREASRTAPVYGLVLPENVPIAQDGDVAVAEIACAGSAGATFTELHVDSLDGIAAFYAGRGGVERLVSGYGALVDFAFSGAAFRFARTSWRYLIFYLYPLLLPLLAIVLALTALQVTGSLGAGVLTGAVAASILAWTALNRLHLMLVMDDWAFARDLAHRRQPAFDAAIERLAERTRRRASDGSFDEIVIAAHSLGAITAVALAARLLRQAKAPMPPIGVLTVGSSLLKVALHPRAAWLRDDVRTIAESNSAWLDVQALTDPIHFYKSHPVRSLGLAEVGSANTMRVRFRDQLHSDRYRQMKFDLFAVHRQFVNGVDRASAYAFHAILLGPTSFAAVAARPGLQQKKETDR